MTNAELKEKLYQVLEENGAKLMGVADMAGIPGRVDECLTIGVSVAVPVSKHIVRDLKTAPTKEYYDAYYSLNGKLNEIVTAAAEFLKSQGYEAYANTTDVVVTDENWRTALPHKTVATRAGLGWIGKSNLLVTKEYGSAIRISSLLTNAPLPVDEAITESKCGACNLCVKACPANALTGKSWTPEVKREEIFHREDCKDMQIKRMVEATGIETDLCGLCFAVCAYTQKYLK